MLDKAIQKMLSMIEDAVDLIRTNASEATVILVGGGSILVPMANKEQTKKMFNNVSEIIVPEHFGNANALGAAIA